MLDQPIRIYHTELMKLFSIKDIQLKKRFLNQKAQQEEFMKQFNEKIEKFGHTIEHDLKTSVIKPQLREFLSFIKETLQQEQTNQTE